MANLALSTIVSNASSVTFQAWVTEIVAALFTSIGVTQTSDTGQINPATVSLPGAINTSAGYVIGRFNDTLQGTAPIFFKLEFGTAGAVTAPGMWLTVGTGSNGSGTITNGGGGAVTTRCAVTGGSSLSSTSTAFTSRYCYINISACGILHIEWKYGAVAIATPGAAYGGFVIARSNDGNGNATASSVLVLTVNSAATFPGNNAGNGFTQVISFSTGAVIPASPTSGWESLDRTALIYSQTSLIESSTGFVLPAYILDPVLKYSAYVGTTLVGDFAVGTTSSFAIIGSSPLTFISAGLMFGASTGYNGGSTAKGLVLPWQ